jgi:hypothetical protein
MPPDGFDQPLPQVFLGVRHHYDTQAIRMLKDVVRTVHPVKLPPGTLHISYQIGAGHLCVWYTLIVIDANIGA